MVEALTWADLEEGKGSKSQRQAYQELEWRRCAADPVYWIEKYARIKSKTGELIPFILWPVQKQLVADWQARQSTVAVKARQLGVTTLLSVFDLWDVLFHEAVEWNLLAATEKKASELVERIQPTITNIPDWMLERARRRPGVREVKKQPDAMFRFVAGFSKMAVMPSTERNIGGAVGNLGWDEFSRHDDQEAKWKLAMPTFDGGGMAVLIANGNGDDYFRQLFEKAYRGDSPMLKAYFFDWMEDPSRLDDTFVVDGEDRIPVRYEGGEGFASKDEAMKAHLEGKLECPWYERMKANYLGENPEADEFDFKMQYPSTKEEAFFITGRTRFHPFWINTHSAAVRAEKLGAEGRWPDVGYLETRDGGVQFNHYARGNLAVWEFPKPNVKYVAGVDLSLIHI